MRENRESITEECFEKAIDKVIGGFERKAMKDEQQEITVAYHEVGHAIVGWFLNGGNPLLKLTIKPRSKGALGFAQYLPSEIELKHKQDLLDQIACILGGRAAEEVFRGCVTTGAYDDFQKANSIAQDIIGTFGMSSSLGSARSKNIINIIFILFLMIDFYMIDLEKEISAIKSKQKLIMKFYQF